MANVYEFPTQRERIWSQVWESLRSQHGKSLQALEALEGCKAEIRHHWDATYYPFSVSPTMPTTRPLSPEVSALLNDYGAAVSAAIMEKIEQQKADLFLRLAELEFRLAYVLKHGRQP